MNRQHLLPLILLLSVAALPLAAQEMAEPDYREIKIITTNRKSSNFYPKLMERYLAGDTTLTLQQYRYLYYGFTLQEDFVPYQDEPLPLIDCRRNLVATAADPTFCLTAIDIARRALDDDPFHLTAISIMAIAHLQIGDTATATLWNIKRTNILEAIQSSGDGQTPETAYHVTHISHEYDVINSLGITVVSDSVCGDGVEYLRVQENAIGEDGFFFNYKACDKVWRKKYR